MQTSKLPVAGCRVPKRIGRAYKALYTTWGHAIIIALWLSGL